MKNKDEKNNDKTKTTSDPRKNPRPGYAEKNPQEKNVNDDPKNKNIPDQR